VAVAALRRLGCQRQADRGPAHAVERHVALAQQGVRLSQRIADLLCGRDGVVKVSERGGVVTSLGRIPHQLAHEDRGFGHGTVQLPAAPARRHPPLQAGDLRLNLPGRS
jgi:hypothetical protein